MTPDPKYFIRAQNKWNQRRLSSEDHGEVRQVGVTHATDYRTVGLVSHQTLPSNASFPLAITSRPTYLENSPLGKILHLGATDLGEIMFDEK